MAKNEDLVKSKAKTDFLTYAAAVIKGRAISNSEDNLKPVQRRILYTYYIEKLWADKKTRKCATIAGKVLALHPHGDSSVYQAMVRMAQPWKMRYPLVEIQGNMGNVLGDGAAASRYTETRLTKVGELMLEDIEKNVVPFKPNYDDTTTEPYYLPSKFPNILANGSNGIAIGISAGLVPHNIVEISQAIQYRLLNPESTVKDLRQFIKGPDFPSGGIITDGERLDVIYETGHGSITLRSKYHLETVGNKTHIVFTEIPFLIDIQPGILAKLKKMILEEGNDLIEDFLDYTDEKNIELRIVISNKNISRINEALNILFTKTNLETSVNVNNMVLVGGEPQILNLVGLVDSYINNRDRIIVASTSNSLEKAKAKQHVTIGIIKSLSNIDLLINIVRNAETTAEAKKGLVEAFELTDAQATAVLDIKLSRLSRLDIKDLANEEAKLEKEIALLETILSDRAERNKIIANDLKEIEKTCGDARKTKIESSEAGITNFEDLTVKDYYVYNGRIAPELEDGALQCLQARNVKEVAGFSQDGYIMPGLAAENLAGGFLIEEKPFVVSVTKQGYVKVTEASEYQIAKKGKVAKVKEDDQIVMVSFAEKDDFVLMLTSENMALKIPVSELKVSGKNTLGSATSAGQILAAMVVNDNDFVLMLSGDQKGKITSVRDFVVNSRVSKGQVIAENTTALIKATQREKFIAFPKRGKIVEIQKDKLAIKSKTAIGASLTAREIEKII